MVKEVPYLYTQLETTLRQLRVSWREVKEGQQRIFHSLEELSEQLKTLLTQLKVSPADFKSALNFTHKVCIQIRV